MPINKDWLLNLVRCVQANRAYNCEICALIFWQVEYESSNLIVHLSTSDILDSLKVQKAERNSSSWLKGHSRFLFLIYIIVFIIRSDIQIKYFLKLFVIKYYEEIL